MHYFGGKFKTCKQIAEVLKTYKQPNQEYFEPFVGAAWVLKEMDGRRVASDGNRALIELYKALQNGWQPPEHISEEQYKNIKSNQKEDALTAFAMVGCSFSGKWAGGYTRCNRGRNYAKDARNSLLRKLPKIIDVEFIHGLYDEHTPKNMLIYCDPPYAGTTGYKSLPKWDSEKFWDVMREWSKYNTVIISEYKAPEDFKCIAEFPTKTDIRGANMNRVERLFKL